MSQWSTRAFNKNIPDPPIPEHLLDEFVVIMLQGKNNFGDKVYCYLKVTLRHLKDMKQAMIKGANFQPSDFGSVLAAGKGDPPENLHAEIEMKHKVMERAAPIPSANAPQQKAWDDY